MNVHVSRTQGHLAPADPSVVCSDEVLKRAKEAAQKELNLEGSGELGEDSFADTELDD